MPELFKEWGVWNPGINDPSMVHGLMMENVGNNKSKLLFFVKRENINERELLKDLHMPPRQVGSIFDSIDDQNSYWSTLLHSILNDHVPLQKMRVTAKDVPYKTLEWKRAIRKKCRFARRCRRNPTAESLLLKKEWRNEATKQRNESCMINLEADGDIEHDQSRVADNFARYYSLIAKDIGNAEILVQAEDELTDYKSVRCIPREKGVPTKTSQFNFRSLAAVEVSKELQGI